MTTITTNRPQKIRSFTDLDAWKKGHELVIMIYNITKKFPSEELFGLTNQLRRAAVSFTSNIAEGFRRRSYKEKLQFFSTSLGSLTEIQNQLLIAKDVGHLRRENFEALAQHTVTTSKITQGLIAKTKILAGI
jgi:four helix bundle protein